MAELLRVSSSPHIRSSENTRSIMADVLIALSPVLIMAVYLFGFRSLLLTAISAASCVLFEYLMAKLLKRKNPTGDLSAVVTGVLLAYNLSPLTPLWMPVVGAFFAIVIVKQLFGGIGGNFVNPALAARVFLFSWPAAMTTWAKPVMNALSYINLSPGTADAVTTATPLAALKKGALPEEGYLQLLLGSRGGCIGETAVLLLVAGGLYLLYRRIITWHIPVSFIATVALLTFVFPKALPRWDFMLFEVLSGGLILGAVFMATDYVTSPINPKGKIIFGIGCGLITVFIRYFGGYPEGVSFSILVMNLLAFTIDKFTRVKKFGGGVKNA